MENKNTSVLFNALTWGFIIGLVSIVYSVILYMLDQTFNRSLGYLSLLILIGGLIIGIRSFRDNVRDGVLPFGTAFGFGVLVVVISSLLGAIYTYLLYTVIDPGLQEKILEFSAEQMTKKNIPEAQIDQALEISKRFMSPIILSITGLFGGGIMGTIISLIIAAIFKKEEPA